MPAIRRSVRSSNVIKLIKVMLGEGVGLLVCLALATKFIHRLLNTSRKDEIPTPLPSHSSFFDSSTGSPSPHPSECHTRVTASPSRNRKENWSIMVCTISSRWGLMASNLHRSPNSYLRRVGHQQMARFLLSMQLSLLRSATLKAGKSDIMVGKNLI